MTGLLETRSARAVAFVVFNLLLVLGAWACIALPIAARFGERADLVREREAELDRAATMLDRMKALSTGARDPFMAAADERVASADLQALLRDMVGKAGARFLGVQGVATPRAPGHRTIDVRLSVDGSSDSIRSLLQEIETGTPLMFVTSTVLGSVGDTPMSAGMLHAEFLVQASLKQQPTPRVVGLREEIAVASVREITP